MCVFQAEKSKKRLKVKLEMAKFLQDTIEETALQVKGKKSGDQPSRAEEFSSFIQRVSNQQPPTGTATSKTN